MAEVVVYARPHNVKIGEGQFVPDPNFNANLAPKIIIPLDVAQESDFLMDIIADFGPEATAIQVDNVEHRDLEETIKLLQAIRDVLGPYIRPPPATINSKGETVPSEKSPSRIRPNTNTTNDSDEKAAVEKAEDAKIKAYITKVIDDGTPEMNMTLLTQMLVTANAIGAVRAVNFLASRYADFIKGKTPEEIRKQFAIKRV